MWTVNSGQCRKRDLSEPLRGINRQQPRPCRGMYSAEEVICGMGEGRGEEGVEVKGEEGGEGRGTTSQAAKSNVIKYPRH